MKIELEIDHSTWLRPEGILKSIYIEDHHEPELEELTTWKELIDCVLESYILPHSGKLAEQHRKDIEPLIKGLQEACDYIKRRVEELGFEE
jgi:hypothetical protein